MGDPAPLYDKDDDERLQSAQDRANQRWGITPPKPLSESENSSEDKTARDRADDHWGMDSDKLKDAEETGGEASAGTVDSKESSLLDDGDDQIGYHHEGKTKVKGKGRLRGRRKTTVGIIAGLTIGGVFGVSSIASGPLQFIHIAQLLQRFHLLAQEDASDDRMIKLARFIRDPKKPEKTRLGILGNKYADAIEGRLNRSGIQSAYTDRLGYFDGYVIDPATIPDESEFSTIKNKSPPEIQEYFKSNYDIDLTPGPDGKLLAKADGLGYFKSRKMVTAMMREAGYSKVGASLRARIMGRRAAITWHPMKKLDAKLFESLDARFTAWRKDRQQRIDNGETTGEATPPPDEGEGDNKKPSQEGSERTNAANETFDEGHEAGNALKEGDAGPLKQFQSGMGVKLLAGGVAAVGVICALQGIAENIDLIRYANVVLPLMRLGMEAVTLGNQVMTGQDADLQQMSFFSKNLYDVEKKSSWAGARSIQAENGDELTGTDIPSEAKLDKNGNVVTEFLNGIPGLNGLCKASRSAFGQVINIGVGILTGPIQFGAGLLTGKLSEPLIGALARHIAGHPISIDVAGADYGNYINYGARLAANDSFIAAGGKALSPVESAQLKQHRIEVQKQEQATKSFAQRMFDPYDADSLISQIIDKQNPDIGSNVTNVAYSFANIGNVFKTIPNTFASFFSSKARAATAATYDYGFPEYGFSLNELNTTDPSMVNPYANATRATAVLDGPKGAGFKSRAQKCFGITFTADGGVASQDSPPSMYEIEKEPGCTDTDPDWLSVRLYIFDTQLMESTACYQGEGASCTAIGFGNGQAQDSANATQ